MNQKRLLALTYRCSLEWQLSRSGSCLYELWCRFLIPQKIIFRFYVYTFEGILCVFFKIVSCVGLNLGAGVVLRWLIFMYVLVANQCDAKKNFV